MSGTSEVFRVGSGEVGYSFIGTGTPADWRAKRYYMPMAYEEEKDGRMVQEYLRFEDGSEILWGTK